MRLVVSVRGESWRNPRRIQKALGRHVESVVRARGKLLTSFSVFLVTVFLVTVFLVTWNNKHPNLGVDSYTISAPFADAIRYQ